MSNPAKNEKSLSVWQPLPQLKSIEIHNAGFQKSEHAHNKLSSFEVWTPHENRSQIQGQTFSDGSQLTNHDAFSASDSLTQDIVSKNSQFQVQEKGQQIDSEFLNSIKDNAFQNGILEGRRLQKLELDKEADELRTASLAAEAVMVEKLNLQIIHLLSEISNTAISLRQNPNQLHEPLKRLSLHLAEQLTLAELSINANSIDNLIKQCIETLDLEHCATLLIELNPSDLSILQEHISKSDKDLQSWRLLANPNLLPGSVKVRADDSVVTDFVENRLESLAQNLLLETASWRAQSAFHPSRLSARNNLNSNIEDALPRTIQVADLPHDESKPHLNIQDDAMNLGVQPLDQDD